MRAGTWTTLWGLLAIVGCFLAGVAFADGVWIAGVLLGLTGVYSLLRTIENAHEEVRR